MTKRFFTKSVAFAFFSILIFGFLSFHLVKADATTATPATTNNATLNQAINAPISTANTSAPTATQQQQLQQLGQSTAINSTSGGGTTYPDNVTYGLFNTPTGSSITAPSWWATVADYTEGILNGVSFLGIATVLSLIGTILSTILALAGALFDGSMYMSIFHISDFFANGAPLVSMWTLIRDALNIAFIFILLYIAISMILGNLTKGAKSTLTSVIVSAVFINFSMFIAKAIIDLGDIFAVALYHKISSAPSISYLLVQNLNLTDFFQVHNFLTASGQTNMIIMLVLENILIGVLIYVFFYGAFIFIGRLIMLMILVATSPVAFVGSSIPWLKEQRDDWWDNFNDQVIVAPVFLFFIVLVVTLLENSGLSNVVTTSAQVGTAGAINVAGYLYYVIVIGLLLEGMKRVKKLSGKTGEMATKIGKGLVVTAGVAAAAVTGGTSLAFSAEATEAATAAKAAGGGGLSQARARLAFSAQKIGGEVGKFARGDHENEHGFTAKVLTSARNTMNEGVKSATGTFVDPADLYKSYNKSLADQIAKNKKAIEPDAKKKAEHEEVERNLKAQDAAITKAAKEKYKEEKSNVQEEHNDNRDKLTTAKEEHKDAVASGDATVIAQKTVQLQKAQDTFANSQSVIENFKNNQEQMVTAFKEEAAQKVGLTGVAELENKITDNQRDMAHVMDKLETRIRAVSKSGVLEGGLKYGSFTSGGKKKIEKSLRDFLEKGGKDSETEQIKKMLEGFAKGK